MPTYPRTTVAAIAAALAATIVTLTVTTLAATTGNITTLNTTTANITTGHFTTASTTNLVVGQGSAVTKIVRATATIDPDSIAAYSCTSSALTVTGAAAGGAVSLVLPSAWATGYIDINASAGTNSVTLGFCNASGTAVDLGSGTAGASVIVSP